MSKPQLIYIMSCIKWMQAIFDSELDWEMKYDIIFKDYKVRLVPLLKEVGISLNWCDPDTTYEEDVTAFMEAVNELEERLKPMGSVRRSY